MELSIIVRGIMHKLGEDPLSFRSRSMRHGCITAGFEAGIPEYLVYLQTGHRGLGGPTAVPAGCCYAHSANRQLSTRFGASSDYEHSGVSTEHKYVHLWNGDFFTLIGGVVVVWEGACSALFSRRGARRGPVT